MVRRPGVLLAPGRLVRPPCHLATDSLVPLCSLPSPARPPAPRAAPAGYDEGNLNWLAAFEVEPASDVMALRVWKTEELTPLQATVRAALGAWACMRQGAAGVGRAGRASCPHGWAFTPSSPTLPPCSPSYHHIQTRLRKAIYTAIHSFQQQHGCREVCDAIDIGCSVGVSSRWLAAEWPAAHVMGLDLSPYFLAVAELRERQLGGGAG